MAETGQDARFLQEAILRPSQIALLTSGARRDLSTGTTRREVHREELLEGDAAPEHGMFGEISDPEAALAEDASHHIGTHSGAIGQG